MFFDDLVVMARGEAPDPIPNSAVKNPQRRWYCVLRRGRVGRRQVIEGHRRPLHVTGRRSSQANKASFTISKPSHGAGWSSPVARQAHNLKVVGSNPTPATTKVLENIDVFKGFFISGEDNIGYWESHGNHGDYKFGPSLSMTGVFVRSAPGCSTSSAPPSGNRRRVRRDRHGRVVAAHRELGLANRADQAVSDDAQRTNGLADWSFRPPTVRVEA